MKLMHMLWAGTALAAGAAGVFPGTMGAQAMICTTTTRTVTEYYSNGVTITWTESLRVCRPMVE